MPMVYSVAGTDDALTISLDGGAGNPVLQGTLVGGGAPNYLNFAYKIFVFGDYAYIVSQIDSGLTVVDISNPAAPATVAYLPLGGSGMDIWGGNGTVFEDILYVVHQTDTFRIIDVSDPLNPAIIRTLAGGGAPNFMDDPRGICVYGDFAYIACDDEPGMTVINVADPVGALYAGGLYGAGAPNFMASVRHIKVDGTHAFAASAAPDNRLVSIDVTNPYNPILISSIAVQGASRLDFLTNRNYLFIAALATDTLRVADVTNPAAMAVIATLVNAVGGNTFDQPEDIRVDGSNVYVAAAAGGAFGNRMVVIDVVNPAAPFQRGDLTGAGAPNYMGSCRGVATTSVYIPVVATQYATDIK